MRPAVGLTLALLALGASPAAPQSLTFTRLSSDDGLSSNSVYTILQDRRGLLWFGTVDGLNRYDGYEFRVWRHRPGDPGSLASNVVRDLLEDRAARLWVATDRSLQWLTPGGMFQRAGLPRSMREDPAGIDVRSLAEDPEGVIWAATSAGLLKGEPGAGFSLAHPSLQGLEAQGVTVDSHGALWATLGVPDAPAGWRLVRVGADGALWQAAMDPALGDVHDLHVDDSGRLWLGHPAPATVDSAGTDRPAWADAVVRAPAAAGPALDTRSVIEAPDGTIWMGSASGLHRIGPDGSVAHFEPDPGEPTWLHNYVRSVVVDRTGALWVGTYAGVYRHDPRGKRFRVMSHDPRDPGSLSVSAVASLLEGEDGALWVGTFGGGLDRIAADGSIRPMRHRPGDPGSLPDDVVWALLRDPGGDIWIGTGGGLARLDPESRTVRRIRLPVTGGPGPQGQPAVTALATDSRGRLWIGCFVGLFLLDPAVERVVPFEPFFQARKRLLAVDWIELDERRDVLWVGMDPGDLGRVDLREERFDWQPLRTGDGEILRSEGVWQIAPDGRGGLWIGSGAGLTHYDPARDSFRHFTVAQGLPGTSVYSLVRDRAGALWMGTGGGLARLEGGVPPEGNPSFRSYRTRDGIAGTEFNRHAAVLLSDGRLAFGGVDGLTLFHPDEVRPNPVPPPVVLTSVRVASRDEVRAFEPAALDTLVLRPADATLTLEFAALSFANPERNRYAWRLEGFDDDWVEAGTTRSARYTNLPPGAYTFRVRGSNEDGVWNRDGAALSVRVLPAVWETTWARVMAVALALVLLALAHRARVGRLLAVERLRLRIARDLHDDLGSDLSGIALATDVVRRRTDLEGEEAERLVRVRNTALEKVEALRDIVWAIDPEHDTLQATVRRIRVLAEGLPEGMEHRVHLDLDDPDRSIGMGVRRNLLLIFKEALHNVIRHSGATRVEISLHTSGPDLYLEVRDDGVGFDDPERRPDRGAEPGGNGLRNLGARAREMGGRLDLESRPGEGTTVRLRVRLDGRMARTRDGAAGRESRRWGA